MDVKISAGESSGWSEEHVDPTQNSRIPLEAEKKQKNRFTLSEISEAMDTTYTLTLN